MHLATNRFGLNYWRLSVRRKNGQSTLNMAMDCKL